MLEPPEKRIQALQFPKSIQDRARVTRGGRHTDRWRNKLKGHFVGKAAETVANPIGQGQRGQLEKEAVGVAKTTSTVEKPKARFKIGQNRRAHANKKGKASNTEACEDSEWLGKTVRVVEEGLHEGRVGRVTSASKYTNSEPPRYQVQAMEEGGKVILTESSDITLELAWAAPKPMHLDYRGVKKAQRVELAKELAITQTALIKRGHLLEDLTVEAILSEIKLRVGVPEGTIIVPPSLAKVLIREGIDTAMLTPEEQAWAKQISEAKHAYVVVPSDAPQHFTFLEVHEETDVFEMTTWNIAVRDSLKVNSENARVAAKTLLQHLKLVAENYVLPPSSNKCHQAGGWECGLWASHYVERALREQRGEGRLPRISEKQFVDRANAYIAKLKESSDCPKPKDKDAEPRAYKNIEPVHETLEIALEAGRTCHKCIARIKGYKGCRACMGEWFEEIRQKVSTSKK